MRQRTSVVNRDQVAPWNGPDGDHWVEHEEIYNAAVRLHARRLFFAARISSDDRVLDVGCGCGESTRQAALLASSGQATGVDLSEHQLAQARTRAAAEGLSNVEFVQADAQTHRFEPGGYDVVISRFGTMFFDDPPAAFTNIATALRPGGRLAMLVWRGWEDNAWVQELRRVVAAGRELPLPPVDQPGPFGLARPAHVRTVLGAAGFGDVALDKVDESIRLGAHALEAYGFVASQAWVRALLDELDGTARARCEQRLVELLAAHETERGVMLGSGAWLVTALRP